MALLYSFRKKTSPSEAGFSRLLFNSASGSNDPVAGNKLISVVETLGNSGTTQLTLKRGLNNVNERWPENSPIWYWDVTGEISWKDTFNIEILIEYTEPTSQSDDMWHHYGVSSDISNSTDIKNFSVFGGFEHSPLVSSDPRMSRVLPTGTTTTTGISGGRHAYLWYNSPKDRTVYSTNIGIADSAWTGLQKDILSRPVLAPNSTSDPVYIVFAGTTVQNLAFGSSGNSVTTFRLWYKITKPLPPTA